MLWLLSLLSAAPPLDVQDGDVIFQTTNSSQSQAIQYATQSPFSHVGIVHIRDGKPVVFEARGPVGAIPLQSWINKGIKGQYQLMRPKKALKPAQIKTMRKAAERYRGKSYDWLFEWSDQKMYCSELVWKLYKEAGIELAEPRPMDSYRFDSPVVQEKLDERWGDAVNWKEKMVAPSDLATSPLLTVIADTY